MASLVHQRLDSAKGRGGEVQIGYLRDRRLFNCGREGNFAINCNQPPPSKSMDFPQVPVERANCVQAVGRNLRKVYLEVLVDGQRVDCLLDTGSEVTIVPGFFVELPKSPLFHELRPPMGHTFKF